MSLFRTSTSAAVTAGQTRIGVGDTSGFPAVGSAFQPQLMMIDGEKMLCRGVPMTGMVDVIMRGYDGSVAVAHDILASVVTSSSAGDFNNPAAGQAVDRPPTVDDQVTLGQDQTLTVPAKNTTYTITKASAAAITLGSGTSAQAGITLTFISLTAFAHVLTYTPGFAANTTLSDTATFTAAVGVVFVAQVLPNGTLAAITPNAQVTLG